MHRNPWLRTGFAAWSLGMEASAVIALRSMKLAAGGPAAATEARRMVAEKIEAGMALQRMAMTGGLGLTPQSATNKAIAHYRGKVRANGRRLAKP